MTGESWQGIVGRAISRIRLIGRFCLSGGRGRMPGPVVCAVLLALGVSTASGNTLEAVFEAFQQAETQTDTGAVQVLRTGLEGNRSAEAYALMRGWLSTHQSNTPALLFYAGRTAEYAGHWVDAATYYRRLLASERVNARLAAIVVPAMYRLLINNLGDARAAYLFMREEGIRLRRYGQARQFDGWFYEQALQRGDLAALAERLAVIYGNATEAPTAQDAEWLDALLTAVETFEHDGEALIAALKTLAAASQTTPQTRARLGWAMAVAPVIPQMTALFSARKDIPDDLVTGTLKAASALLATDPVVGVPLVVKGWTRLNHGDTPTFFRYVYAHRERKAEPIFQVLQTLSPEQAKALLASGARGPRGRWVSVASFLAPAQARSLVLRSPAIFNAIDAPVMDLWDKDMTVDEAKALAPHLARNSHPHAALIRAYAAAGSNTVSAMVSAMMKSERWRFDNAKSVVDTVWNSGADRSGANHGELVKQYEAQGERHDQLQKQLGKDVDSKSRLAAFAAIYNELRGRNPATPGLLSLWDALLTQAPSADQEKMLQKLVADFVSAPQASQGQQQHLLGQALASIDFGNAYSRLAFGPEFAGGWDRWGHQNVRKALPGLAADLGKLLRQQMVAGSLSAPVFGMWLHCVDPGKAEATALFKELVKSNAYAAIDPAYHAMAAHGLLFGQSALLLEALPSDPGIVSRELLALPADAPAAAVEAALKAVMDRAASAPAPVMVHGLRRVAALEPLSGTARALVLRLFNQHAPLGAYPAGQGYEQLVIRLVKDMQVAGQWGTIEPYVADFWRSADTPDDGRHYRVADALVDFAEAALADGAFSAASAVARTGLFSDSSPVRAGNTQNNAPQRLSRLQAVLGNAMLAMGVSEIPVDETHPDYGIHLSHSGFVQGNWDTAWNLYLANADRLLSKGEGPDDVEMIRAFPSAYAFWLLQRNIEERREVEAEALARAMTVWSRQTEGAFSREQEAELQIAYADLALLKGALQTARAWYRRVADAREYSGTEMHARAILGSVRVDRISRNFSAAMQDLERLSRNREPLIRKQVHFARAEVLVDQENYSEAYTEVEAVLGIDQGDADGLILRGKIQHQLRQLVEASEIALGATQASRVIVPGEMLTINLYDPTLSVAGVSVDIEVDVVTKSGDRERLLLYPFGDSRDRFRAEIPTALGAPVPGDRVLQVLGEDEIRYGYSERFRQRMRDLPPDPVDPITIASDAQLTVAAGALPALDGQLQLNIEELGISSAQQALGRRTVRPGNPIYIRVVDPDQSKSREQDTIYVSLQTTSGDTIRRQPLVETEPYSGVFEAAVPTAPAPASAFASDSAPGRDPNMAISPQQGAGWQGQIGLEARGRTFSVDLNDNVALDRMRVVWGDASQQSTHFVLQSSLNGRDWSTHARFPEDTAPWDGRPRVSSFPTYGRNAISIAAQTSRSVPADWQEKMELTSIRRSITYAAEYVPSLAAMKPAFAAASHPGYSILMQYRALFYQPYAAMRRFRLRGYPAEGTIFLLNGKPADASSEDALLIERELEPGLHEIQVWRHESRGDLVQRTPVVLQDVPGQEELQPCPDEMFDPASFPSHIRQAMEQPASITDMEGRGVDVSFGANTQARLVRLVIHGFDGVAPVIQRVALQDKEGKTRLPVAHDFLALRQNMQLEVLPGDRITVVYDDPLYVTENRGRREQRLNVAYNDGSISASFINFETTREGERKLLLEPIRRFNYDAAIAIVVDDIDMDRSGERDQINFRITTSDGKDVAQRAVETEPHSGQFVGRVFPVAGQPSRAAEVQVPAGGSLTAVYRDEENLNPGIATDRSVTILHAQYAPPRMGVYTMHSEALPDVPPAASAAVVAGGGRGGRRRGREEAVQVRRTLNYSYVDTTEGAADTLQAIMGSALRFDVVAPHLALAGSSTVSAYVQVVTNQQAIAADVPFDIALPGTLKLTGPLQRRGGLAPLGYQIGQGPQPPTNQPALEEGRFAFSVPVMLGERSTRSYATRDAESLPASLIPEGLAVQAGDQIRIGFAWQDPEGQVYWRTARVALESDVFLDVMNESYDQPLQQVFVGERAFVRLVAPGLSRPGERSVVAVDLLSRSGAKARFNLRETEPDSGVFRGGFSLEYVEGAVPVDLPPVELNGFPVQYGDAVTVQYGGQARSFAINMGSDGTIEAFTKRFSADEMAVETSFTLAESYFELAKKHREMGDESLARRMMAHAQKLLAEAMATYRDDELRAQAEYFLGNLSQEFGDLAQNDMLKMPMYQDALARFSLVLADYPDSELAPKSQFKLGLVYERMGEMDIALEEYVKLAYQYPENEHIPEVMSRLGSYFQRKGQEWKEQADALREKTDMESQADVLRLDRLSYPEYIRAANIFEMLLERFPDHHLAGLAGLRSGQNYMRAHMYNDAILRFTRVFNNDAFDGREIRAQSMYWCGLSHERRGAGMSEANWKGRGEEQKSAYDLYRRVTFDFPDSQWAKFARGRLADPVFSQRMQQEQAERERMLEQIREQERRR